MRLLKLLVDVISLILNFFSKKPTTDSEVVVLPENKDYAKTQRERYRKICKDKGIPLVLVLCFINSGCFTFSPEKQDSEKVVIVEKNDTILWAADDVVGHVCYWDEVEKKRVISGNKVKIPHGWILMAPE